MWITVTLFLGWGLSDGAQDHHTDETLRGIQLHVDREILVPHKSDITEKAVAQSKVDEVNSSIVRAVTERLPKGKLSSVK